MDKFCALDTFPHSGSGQARLIKALCGLSKHSPGPVTLARGNWCADHVTDRRGFQRQNRCSGQPEGRECLCLRRFSGMKGKILSTAVAVFRDERVKLNCVSKAKLLKLSPVSKAKLIKLSPVSKASNQARHLLLFTRHLLLCNFFCEAGCRFWVGWLCLINEGCRFGLVVFSDGCRFWVCWLRLVTDADFGWVGCI